MKLLIGWLGSAAGPWILVVLSFVLVATHAAAWHRGAAGVQRDWDEAKAQAVLGAAKLAGEQAGGMRAAEKEYVDATSDVVPAPVPVDPFSLCRGAAGAGGAAVPGLPGGGADPGGAREAAAIAEALASDAARLPRCLAKLAWCQRTAIAAGADKP